MLYVVTSTVLCRDDFLRRIRLIAAAGADRLLLREKHLEEPAYCALAKSCVSVCREYSTAFSVNSFTETARLLECDVHLPLKLLEQSPSLAERFATVGVSVHSREEAVRAWQLGASYLVAGHIFPTDCKKGLPPRGLGFLTEIVRSAPLPVLAIGGITRKNVSAVRSCGAAGFCVMSELMTCPPEEIAERVTGLKQAWEE